MSDAATGPISGFLFQFEKALLILAGLTQADEFISVEDVDDIAIHDSNIPDKILFTFQAKHSLSLSGSTFEDSSRALWRTLEIWIQKREAGTFSADTKFICSTNKTIPPDALIRLFTTKSFEDVEKTILELQGKLKKAQSEKKKAGQSSPHITYILKLIKFALEEKEILKGIAKNIIIEDEEDVKPKFLELMRLTIPGIKTARQDDVYQNFYGWLLDTCQANWRNAKSAAVSKKQFDAKWVVINSNPQIINAIFRKKSELGSLTAERIEEVKDELFVRQINDISRGPGAKHILEKAMLDYIHHEIEMGFVIHKGDFTSTDFEQFRSNCLDAWRDHFYSLVLKDEYTEEESNAIAIAVFDGIMQENTLQFNEGFQFTPSNRYIKNGSFLKLSNLPEIGWRPDWTKKYGKL
jgi:hypothetical protein